MKTVIKTAAAVAACLPLVSCQESRPNIVLFLIDDFGWADTQIPFGAEAYPTNMRHDTPNMLRLAERGAIMTSAYACPVSSPTRTSLMSGMNAAHTGITNWTASMRNNYSDATVLNKTDYNNFALTDEDTNGSLMRPDWTINGIFPAGYEGDTLSHVQRVTAYPEILKRNGYYTIHVGKAHWAPNATPGSNPLNFGFLVNISGTGVGKPRSYFSEDNYGNLPQKWNEVAVQNMTEYYQSGIHLTDAITREALKTMDYPIEQGIPFYLNMCHYATHTPIQGDPRYLDKYLERGMDLGQARYASLVEGVDHSLGVIMDYLEKRGVMDNTIIILMADNGGNSENMAKGGVMHTQNLPLREGKGSCYEGGIRVPMVVVWPSKVAPGVRINNPVTCEDLYPTILSMAGVKHYRAVQSVDGKDLCPLLEDGSKDIARHSFSSQREATEYIVPQSISGIEEQRAIVMHYPHQWKPYRLEDIDYMSSIRRGEWKLVYRMRTGKLELYNLSEDIGERNDLAAEYPERVRNLASELSLRFRQWNTPMPVVRESGQRVAYADEVAL